MFLIILLETLKKNFKIMNPKLKNISLSDLLIKNQMFKKINLTFFKKISENSLFINFIIYFFYNS